MNRIIALVIALVVVAFAASSTVFVVDPRHAAVLSARGEGEPTLLGPGLHVKLPPPLQTAALVDTRLQTLEWADAQSCTTSDKQDVLVSPAVRYRITDPLKYYAKTDAGSRDVVDPLLSSLKGALTQAFSTRTLTDAIRAQQAIADEAKASLQAAVAPYGVEIVDVSLLRVDLPAAASEAAYRRMSAAERERADTQRAEGAASAEQIKADAMRQQQQILADGYQSAQSIKGEGDAKAASIAGDAYGRDPQFYQFYASLQAYRNTFHANDVIVVDPDSEFFRFMRSPTGGSAATPAPAPRKH
ncbi:protease modulator HflC [Burkholderia sp. 22PA0106]|uniref:protease modulator HflC n=1 Tax=Burkholderia sp. 22PA0106 TaxID=3237371 RepID=UPI0039C1ACC5